MYISCLVSNSEKGFCYIIDYFQVKEEIKYVEDLKKKNSKSNYMILVFRQNP